MGMLNAHDIAWMEQTVREIITDWETKIQIYSRLPLEQQPNYNHLMHEFTGDSYCTMIEVDAERKDMVNYYSDDPDMYNMQGGIKDDGTYFYAIHDVRNGEKYKPSLHDIVTTGDGEVYYIRGVKDRIGESIIIIKRFTGNTPHIEEIEIKEEKMYVIRDYDWSGEDGN